MDKIQLYTQREQLLQQLDLAITDDEKCDLCEQFAGIESSLRELDFCEGRISQEEERDLLFLDKFECIEYLE